MPVVKPPKPDPPGMAAEKEVKVFNGDHWEIYLTREDQKKSTSVKIVYE